MSCVANYCPSLDVLYSLLFFAVYGLGVLASVWYQNRKYQREVDAMLEARLKPYTRY